MLSNATTPAPIHDVCPVAPATYFDVFATTIDDRALLRFVRILAAADAKTRASAVAAARIPLDVATAQAVAAATAAMPCSDAIVGNAQARMASVISLVWGLSSDAEATRMTDRIGVVAAALAARHALDPKLIDGLVSPFGTTLAALDAPAPTAAPGPNCAVPDAEARTIRVTMPSYPAMARAAGTTGLVRITVSIDSDGDVVTASVYKDDLGGLVGANAIRESSLLSAATTEYAPAIRACSAVAGSYLFRADFTRGR